MKVYICPVYIPRSGAHPSVPTPDPLVHIIPISYLPSATRTVSLAGILTRQSAGPACRELKRVVHEGRRHAAPVLEEGMVQRGCPNVGIGDGVEIRLRLFGDRLLVEHSGVVHPIVVHPIVIHLVVIHRAVVHPTVIHRAVIHPTVVHSG